MMYCNLLIGFLLFFYSQFVSAQEKPNILWITMEDTSPQFIGCYGDSIAQTPVMDRMAAEGVRFTSAFSTGTVCSPSRSTIITGVPTYKLGTGNHRSNYAIPDFIKGFPYYLQQNGYYVSNNKKTDYNLLNAKEFTQEAWNESSTTAGWWNRKPEQPFFSVFNIEDSHQSRTMTWSYELYEKHVLSKLRHEDETKQSPLFTKDNNLVGTIPNARGKHSAFDNLHKSGSIKENEFNVPPFYRDSKDMRKQLARVYNSIKLTDIKMGEIIQRLNDDDLLDETIIFIFADHGEGIPRGKANGIGLGYRIPFIIWFPEKYKYLSPWGVGGAVTDELINFEDLAPTLLSLTKTPIPEHLKGRPFLGQARQEASDLIYLSSDRSGNAIDLVRTVTDGRLMYSRNFMPFYPELAYLRYFEIGEITQQIRKDYKNQLLDSLQSSIFNKRPVEFLYDLQNDPWETNNLAENFEYRKLIKKMRLKLKDNVITKHDIHFAPEYELNKISETGFPYEYRGEESRYPIRKIYETASLVGYGDNTTIKKLFIGLENPNEIIRYWASIGLFSSKEELNGTHLKIIENHLKDEYSPVQIILAALLYAEQQCSQAATVLKHYIEDPNVHLALAAINHTLYFKKRDEFTESVQKTYSVTKDFNVRSSCLDFLDLQGLVGDGDQ
ncbi:sulfatase [Arenibacter palladensis]|uniref:sulfatase family protein n=1 Tax=Arenibacter palladensis TaxID=237373 RepID=UPI0026E3D7D5|nr:sulfatase [Arenibacter palladensis]MDO6604997.1 sulfatase [Arenibacter palladensis]